MKRRRTNKDGKSPRASSVVGSDRRTLIPSFDAMDLAAQIQEETNSGAPPYDPSSYARIVDERALPRDSRDLPGPILGLPRENASVASRAIRRPKPPVVPELVDESMLATELPPARQAVVTSFDDDDGPTDLHRPTDEETLGREMYGCYLASSFPEALVLAERVLATSPDHALARLVADQCRERLQPPGATLKPSSVLRLKYAELVRHASYIDPTSSMVIDCVDGVTDAATVAALTGLPDKEALERLHALLNLGVLELVSA